MKKFLISLSLIIAGTLTVFADGRQEALSFFNSYVNAANTYSNSVGDMYSPNAKIIRQVIKPDGTTADAVTDTATYLKQMKLGQAGARIKGYKNNYTNVTATPVAGGYKISSLRQPSGESYKLKTYMIVEKQPNGKWLITEELMQTKVQTFLRYANK